MLEIDGSQGEGGGQILRTSLGLSLVTGTPVRIHSIRARRDRPGLQKQHLVAVQAAAEVGHADVKGAALGSGVVSFMPGRVKPGSYAFSIGSAGSASLVLQTVLPALLTASSPSTVALEGGTHNPWAPPADFLERAFLPLLGRMGPSLALRVERRGFYPAGGGRMSVTIRPVPTLSPLHLPERGPVRAIRATAVVASLPRHIAERELARAEERLDRLQPRVVEDQSARGPGNVLTIEIESQEVTEVFTGVGRKRLPAERVADAVCDEARLYLDSGVPVGEHLADQLLLPLALAGGGSFVTTEPSAHTRTNLEVIRQFLGTAFAIEPGEGAARTIRVGG